MATDLQNLITRKSEIISALTTIGTAPDYSINGQSVQRSSNRRALLEELKTINELIAIEQGPALIEIEGIT